MGHVHVQAHADRVGGDQIIDLARLEHRHLGVAGAWAERPHHHCRAAAQPPQHLGDSINLLGRKGDDDRAFGQARQLGRPGIAQRRKARAGDDLGIGDQRPQHRPERLRTQDHRFLAPARMENAIGEDMAALGIGADLPLIERDRVLALDRNNLVIDLARQQPERKADQPR